MHVDSGKGCVLAVAGEEVPRSLEFRLDLLRWLLLEDCLKMLRHMLAPVLDLYQALSPKELMRLVLAAPVGSP